MENNESFKNNDDNRHPSLRAYDRRSADIEEVINIRTRVAVLEKIAENHENRISDMEDFHRSVVERLDQKIQMDATNQIIIERTLTKAVTSIEALSENLKTAVAVAGKAEKLATRHETIGATVVKLVGWFAVVIGGIWALVRFFLGM